ncbi:MAG: hypothetical protein DRQ55_07230 [Planctomycetota bacterium]|nr:MAG: hypothetical protein DRQ55_07230 [Planctomycetota bacterium]
MSAEKPSGPAPAAAPREAGGDPSWTPLDEARLQVYQVLSLAASDPRSERWPRLREPAVCEAAVAAARFLADQGEAQPHELAPGETSPSGLDLAELMRFAEAPRDELGEEHQRVFGLVQSKECPPCESDYCPQTFSVYRSQRMADVAGFYRAFGLQPSRDMPEHVDHVALELEFMAWLLAKRRHALQAGGQKAAEQAGVCAAAERDFAEEHLAWWLPAFARALRTKADGQPPDLSSTAPAGSFYSALGACLAAFVPAERALLGIAPSDELARPAPTDEPEGGCEGCSPDVDPDAD